MGLQHQEPQDVFFSGGRRQWQWKWLLQRGWRRGRGFWWKSVLLPTARVHTARGGARGDVSLPHINRTNHFVGVGEIELRLEAVHLDAVGHLVPGTEVFVTDRKGTVVATTDSSLPTFSSEAVPTNYVLPASDRGRCTTAAFDDSQLRRKRNVRSPVGQGVSFVVAGALLAILGLLAPVGDPQAAGPVRISRSSSGMRI